MCCVRGVCECNANAHLNLAHSSVPFYRELILPSRGAVSLLGCSDSGHRIDSDSDSASGFDAKYKINNAVKVERVSAAQAK